MKRRTPPGILRGVPCSVVAVSCATGGKMDGIPDLKDDGYCTLQSANRYIRAHLKVKKRIDFRRGLRPLLRDLHLDGRAIVCALGHFLYLDHETYWSFFKNSGDEVVAIWVLDV